MTMPRRGIYILPNLFTSASLFSGFYAIIAAAQGQFEIAVLAVIISGVLDGFDGRVARLTGTTSEFGKEYDSLADLIAFGLAPAILAYHWGLDELGRVGWLAAFLHACCTALRLARFNVQASSDRGHFQGLPSPAAAGILVVTIWLMLDSELTPADGWPMYIVFFVAVSTALAMVSNFRYRSFKEVHLRERVRFMTLLLGVGVIVLVSLNPPLILFLISMTYLLSGPALSVWRRRELLQRKRKRKIR
ncbi:CDP-diacylglycerol--serine O-phosphatidyltransferase [Gammaproteobacteria bacterium]|nr:CDP-diacylglycerol--serine O-phosphatidyltransferase [Gammaproteobacteria bacterium]